VEIINGEVVYMQIFDVGRSINLDNIASVFPGIRYEKIKKTKDTPSTIDFPAPFIIEVTNPAEFNSEKIHTIRIQANLYADGVISLIARIIFKNLQIEELHTLKNIDYKLEQRTFKIFKLMKYHFSLIHKKINKFINRGLYNFDPSETEKYTCFCITEGINNTQEILNEKGKYIATLLIGEDPNLNLHPNQISNTLSHTFSFSEQDLIILDLDRCIIFDPSKDYEDILLIIELSNYQLLELRTLDRLTDSRLKRAQSDVRGIYIKKKIVTRRLNKKLGRLYRLRIDLLFTLENVENVSKLIGDFYLAQIYTDLGKIFQLDQWSESIRMRFGILNDIYSNAVGVSNERIILYVEILLGVIFTLEFILFVAEFIQLYF